VVDTYDYEREFRTKIAALCLDNSWMTRYGDALLKSVYFSRDDEVAFVDAVITYRAKFGKSPIDPSDVIALCNGKFSTFVLDVYEIYDEHDLDLAADVAIRFAKDQAAKLAILDSVDDVMSGKIGKAIERMKDALKVGEDLLPSGIDPIADIDMWLYDYWTDKVRTGLYHVDMILEGGLAAGEEGIILAPPNRGKSLSLINIGYGAATIGSGKNVLHISHEMRTVQVAKRYAARMVFRFPNQNDNLDEYADKVVEAARKLLVGKIRIIGGTINTTEAIESYIERLLADGFEIGLILDDYLDYVKSPKTYTDRRFELAATYVWYRELCMRHNIPGWSASQAGRQALSKEVVTMADISESIEKANIADVILALCQTYDEAQANQCRLYMAKVRDGKSKSMVACKYYDTSQAIVTTGIITKKEEDDV